MAKAWMVRLVLLGRKRGTARACSAGHMGRSQEVKPSLYPDARFAQPPVYRTKLKRGKQRLLPDLTATPTRKINRTI